jgi:protein-tyrosine phosphatase
MTAEELDYYNIEAAVDFEGATWLWVPVEDDDAEPIADHFDKVIAAIERARAAGKATLIHCMAGVSRSPTLAAVWLMHHYSWTADRALAHLKDRRPCVDPNAGFKHQLLTWLCGA